jgi:hypothetical protein
MSTISFQCYSCGQVLKVGLDKAGKRGKCPKCGTLLTIPISSTVAEAPPKPAAPAPPPVPAAPAQPSYPPPAGQPQYPAPPQYPQAPAPAPYPAAPPQYAPGPAPAGPMRAELVDDGQLGAPPQYVPQQYAPAEDAYLAEVEEPARQGEGFGPWPRARLGLLLVFISLCVIAGAFLFELIGYLLMTIDLIRLLSGSPPSGGRGVPAFWLMFRIAEPLALAGSLGCVAGYVFCMLGPHQRGVLPLAIVALVLGTLHLVLALIFRLPVIYGFGYAAPHAAMSPVAGFGVWFGLLLTQMFFGAELIMFPFCMRALCSIRKKYGAMGACMAPAILAMVYTGLRLIGWVVFYVMGQSRPTSEGGAKAIIWTNVILLWIGTIVFTIFIILYILAVWRVRRAVSR